MSKSVSLNNLNNYPGFAKINELGIPLKFRTNRLPKVTLGVNSSGLTVKFPKGTPLEEVDCVVQKQLEWIVSATKKYLLKRDYEAHEDYQYLGKVYKLELFSGTSRVEFMGNNIVVYTPNKNKDQVKRTLTAFCQDNLELLANEILYQQFQRLPQIKSYPTLAFKSYRSRWGVCYFQKNLIILNKTLIHLPLEIIEYVITHELVHLIHPNHSKEFHKLLQTIIPNELILKKKMAQFSPTYE